MADSRGLAIMLGLLKTVSTWVGLVVAVVAVRVVHTLIHRFRDYRVRQTRKLFRHLRMPF